MARYQVVLAYDGTDFQGFQRQKRARTVQGVVEDALRQLGWQGRSLLAAGRTDTGVHASGQVAAFDHEGWAHTPGDLQRALNATLPPDVAAVDLSLAPQGFHPRYDAAWRAYRYRIFCRPIRDPLRERFAWRVWPAVDFDRLQQAAAYLIGQHDFAAFGSPPHKGGSTLRTVLQAAWHSREDLLVFEVTGHAFLYHMVRRMVFLQVKVGQGLDEAQGVQAYLEGVRGPIVGLAPSQGLILTEVCYSQDE